MKEPLLGRFITDNAVTFLHIQPEKDYLILSLREVNLATGAQRILERSSIVDDRSLNFLGNPVFRNDECLDDRYRVISELLKVLD